MGVSRYITYCTNVFIPLTNVCSNACGYCGFRRDIGAGAHLMSESEVRELLSRASGRATEALFTFGDRPQCVEGFSEMLDAFGYVSFTAYIRRMCRLAIAYGLLPHTNAGVLTRKELEYLAPFNASMGLMLETTARLSAHRHSPSKEPRRRIRMLKEAGRLGIPFTTGILVGIGESERDRERALRAIARLHERHGHIQEVIVQNFSPKRGTPMEHHPPPSLEEMAHTVRMARQILPDDVAVQVPPNLVDVKSMVEAGANDLGGISSITVDHINPEDAWPSPKRLQETLRGYVLRERLSVYPRYVLRGWYGSATAHLIRRLSDTEGFRRV
ncbi:MAG: 7,8-didemethyl-8-hydroxy-5-deazariboflavin synthase [Methanosarcinales archaeon]|nr:MAG: FO synthase subunit 1 [Euryarchaeota archaeon 55_53]KUK30772.1 MAG: FO synthase subunit 1 [Methanosarcinales archeaon 56_1174]MDI3487961.1 7,8-didemethyl-8-hydroxy-5-deazariboflavin synthase [Methanosarcinales archaeon]MDN5295099.1 7,8-didemethyl-8-hydroxy-5-deazariboflavin synthase [Methanosarcinales archaeon]